MQAHKIAGRMSDLFKLFSENELLMLCVYGDKCYSTVKVQNGN